MDPFHYKLGNSKVNSYQQSNLQTVFLFKTRIKIVNIVEFNPPLTIFEHKIVNIWSIITLTMPLVQILIAIIAVINIFAFIVMANDKRKSIAGGNTERIPEGILFFLATAFGSIGIYTAMLLLRHKTHKWYFQGGIPLLILQNVATGYVIWQYMALN